MIAIKKGFTLAIGWTDCELFPKGLILNLLLAEETFNSFQMDGIANRFFVVKNILTGHF